MHSINQQVIAVRTIPHYATYHYATYHYATNPITYLHPITPSWTRTNVSGANVRIEIIEFSFDISFIVQYLKQFETKAEMNNTSVKEP